MVFSVNPSEKVTELDTVDRSHSLSMMVIAGATVKAIN